MTSVSVASTEGDPVQVSETAFGREFNEPLVHQAVVAWLAGARTGSKAQKSRADVRGGGRKPWRQKRTGRARAGSIRSPIWVGGGRTFAARPADHSQKLNRKMYRGAMRCIFSELVRQNRLFVIPASDSDTPSASPSASLSLDAPKTKLLANRLNELGFGDVLILTHEPDRNLELAARNLPRVELREVGGIDPVCLIAHENVLATEAALKAVEERLS